MKRKHLLLIAAVVLVTALLAAALSQWFSIPSNMPYSAMNPDATGLKALWLLFQQRGIRTEIWKNDYESLPDSSGHTLMIVQPQTDPPDPKMKQALIRWAEKGNQVILWSHPNSPWGKAFELEGKKCETPNLIVPASTSTDNPWFREIRLVKWPNQECLEKNPVRIDLLENHLGDTLVAEQTVGNGRLVFVPEAEVIFNRSIDQADDFAIPLGLVDSWNGTVYFDETVRSLTPILEAPDSSEQENELSYEPDGEPMESDPSLNEPDRNSMGTDPPLKLKADVWFVIFQLVLFIALWLYAKGKRFGAPRFERARKRREGTRQVEAMARWFMKLGGRKEALLRQHEKLKRDLLQILRLPANVSEEVFLQQIGTYLGQDFRKVYEETGRWITQAKSSPRNVSAKTMVRLYGNMIQLRKEILEWKTK
jgi:hypothetical protein